MVNIGRFAAAQGLGGEVRVLMYSDDSQNMHEGSVLLTDMVSTDDHSAAEVLSDGSRARVFNVTAVRMHKGMPVITLEGVGDRTAAEKLTGREIFIREDDLAELPEGRYYFRDLVGLEVFDRASGQTVGKIEEVIDGAAQDIFRVGRDGADDVLIPNVDAFVKRISVADGVMEVELIPGFLE
jgi:16S rRNA processing protein RimM